MQKRIILGLAGAPGTGKSTVADYLKNEYGFTIFEGSDYLKKTAASEGLTLKSRKDYDSFHRQKQIEHGLTWLADAAIALDTEKLVFSGLRTRPNALKLRATGGFIIGLHCPSDICLARMDLTNPKNAQTTEEYANQLLEQESDTYWGAHAIWVADNADFKIDTSLPIDSTYTEIDKIYSSIALPA